VAKIKLADELIILLIFVNNEHFVNTVTMRKVSHVDKNANAESMSRYSEQFSKSNNSCV